MCKNTSYDAMPTPDEFKALIENAAREDYEGDLEAIPDILLDDDYDEGAIESEQGFFEHDLHLDDDGALQLRPDSHRTEKMLLADLCGKGADLLYDIDWEA